MECQWRRSGRRWRGWWCRAIGRVLRNFLRGDVLDLNNLIEERLPIVRLLPRSVQTGPCAVILDSECGLLISSNARESLFRHHLSARRRQGDLLCAIRVCDLVPESRHHIPLDLPWQRNETRPAPPGG